MNLSFKLFPSSILAGFLLFFLAPFVQAEMPVVVHNDEMILVDGDSETLHGGNLRYTNADDDIEYEDVIYEITELPENIEFELYNAEIGDYEVLSVGDTFTQENISLYDLDIDAYDDPIVIAESQEIMEFKVRFNGHEEVLEDQQFKVRLFSNIHTPKVSLTKPLEPIYRPNEQSIKIFDGTINITDEDYSTDHNQAICWMTILMEGYYEYPYPYVLELDESLSTVFVRVENEEDGAYISGCSTMARYASILKTLKFRINSTDWEGDGYKEIKIYTNYDGMNVIDFGAIGPRKVKLDDQNYTGSVDITNSKLLAGDDIKLKVNDMDMNRYANLKETVTVEVKNSTTGEEENITLTETGVNTGIFEADLDTKLKSSCSTSEDNDDTGKLCVTKSDQITAKYIDGVDQSGNTNKSRTDNITVSSSSSTGGGGGGSNDDDDDDDNGSVKGEDSQTVCKREYGFPDICNTKFKTYIKNLKSKNVVNGNSAGYFEPGREITRAEFAAIIRKAFGYELNTGGAHCFKDVSTDNKFWADIQTLCKNGVVVGFGDGTEYRPSTNITRGQAVQIIARAMEKKGTNITTSQKHSFLDVDEKNKFLNAINFMSTTRQDGEYIVAGFENGKYFKNDNNITRGESAKIVEVSMRYHESKK